MNEETVLIKVVTPGACSSITFEDADGGTLTITRQGAEVPGDLAEKLINEAAETGIQLVEVSQE